MTFLDSVDTMLLGRVTYEMFAGHWPNVTTRDDRPFADKLNAMPQVVVSKTLKSAPWGKWGDANIVKDGGKTSRSYARDPARESCSGAASRSLKRS